MKTLTTAFVLLALCVGAVAQTYKPGAKPADFTLQDEKGAKVSLSSLKGKTVVLNFYASW
jgi:cytochrome oxidase Cu insertion factor (SCO1/SenC/PrrC family)